LAPLAAMAMLRMLILRPDGLRTEGVGVATGGGAVLQCCSACLLAVSHVGCGDCHQSRGGVAYIPPVCSVAI
jgi:hypothetical protein